MNSKCSMFLAAAALGVLAGCGSSPDPQELLESLTGPVACTGDVKGEDDTVACLTESGAVSVQRVDGDPGLRIAMGLDNGEGGLMVWHADGWLSTAPTPDAAQEVADQLGGEIVTQAYYEREFVG